MMFLSSFPTDSCYSEGSSDSSAHMFLCHPVMWLVQPILFILMFHIPH